MFVATKL